MGICLLKILLSNKQMLLMTCVVAILLSDFSFAKGEYFLSLFLVLVESALFRLSLNRTVSMHVFILRTTRPRTWDYMNVRQNLHTSCIKLF